METFLHTLGKKTKNIFAKNKVVRGISLGLALSIASTGAGVGYKTRNAKIDKQITYSESDTKENSVGYNDIDLFCNTTVHQNEFIALHVNRENYKQNADLIEKLKKANEAGISISIILDSNAISLNDIYQDVDFLQAIVSEYKIDLPVYLNIENIMHSKVLNSTQKTAILSAFSDKISRSNMYYGFYGKDTTLTECSRYIYDLSPYDCYLVKENNPITFPHTARIVEDLDGRITSTEDIAKIISSKGYNDSEKIVLSAIHEVKEAETFYSLSLKYGLSIEDLQNYNPDLGEELKLHDKVRIPNLLVSVNQTTKDVQFNYAINRGLDISSYQEDIDYEEIAKNFQYVIVEVCRNDEGYDPEGGTYLSSALPQIKGVISANLSLGLYFEVTKEMNKETFKKRMTRFFNNLDEELTSANLDINKANVPVFLDFELYTDVNDYAGLMSIFKDIALSHGYQNIGIYGNASTLRSISKNMEQNSNKSLKEYNYKIWQAGGPQYSAHENTDPGISVDDLVEIKAEADQIEGFVPDMLQVTNVCNDSGAYNSARHCDVSYNYDKDIFGNSLPEESELLDTITIDLSDYAKGRSTYELYNILMQIIEGIFNVSVSIALLAISGYTFTVAIYYTKEKKLKKRK